MNTWGDPVMLEHRPPFRLRWALWGGAAALLSLPAIAMQFTAEVQWGALDFVVMGAMLATLCGLVELGRRLSPHWAYRAGFALAALTGFMTIWVNLAVGMIGDEDDPANLVFLGVLVVAAGGALVARFRPRGLAWAMLATALAMALGSGLALLHGEPRAAVLILLWVGAWLCAGALFGYAGSASRAARAA